MSWNVFFLFRWRYRYLLRTTLHHKPTVRTYDIMIIVTTCHCDVQTRGVSILWAGPDHHTSRYKSILTPHYENLIIIWAYSLYTIHTWLLGCDLRAAWTSYNTIPRGWAIHSILRIHAWATRGELYVHVCQVVAPVALMHVFRRRRWEIFI